VEVLFLGWQFGIPFGYEYINKRTSLLLITGFKLEENNYPLATHIRPSTGHQQKINIANLTVDVINARKIAIPVNTIAAVN